ncbi:MAG TPA: tryptophan synthase subunit alpha [Terriglobales bacterium]|jgi:tryptophan synthase alpha chain|nr:tryptophan synthase subunit alpha [Terriglobales bacterium]
MAIQFDIKPSLVAYVTCGDPDPATTREIVLAAIDAGTHVVELGVPFSDPVADGPVIQRASERALRNGTTLAQVLELAREVRKERPQAGLIVFSYLNPVLRLGLSRFCAAAADAGVDGSLITDLPVEEAGDYLRTMRARELATVFLAAPTSTDERLKRIADASRGFVYAVSRTGVTGTRDEVAADARELVRRLRRITRLPVAVGFGISTPAHFAEVGEFADAAVVGSAIVQVIEQAGRERAPHAVADLIRALSNQHSAFSSVKLQADC